MLKKYDTFFGSLIFEGRKKDEVKKFTTNVESIRKLVDELDSDDEHRGHFKSILLKLKDKDFYTPKTFKHAIAQIFRQLKKGEIADGYATIFYNWLKNHDECPFSPYEEPQEQLDQPASQETQEWFNREEKPKIQKMPMPEYKKVD
jgi:rubrerythrin